MEIVHTKNVALQNACCILDLEKNTLAHLHTKFYQHIRVPVCAQCAGNVRAQNVAGFIVPEELVPPADNGSKHLII